jgi:hypothetical protein
VVVGIKDAEDEFLVTMTTEEILQRNKLSRFAFRIDPARGRDQGRKGRSQAALRA